MAKLRHTQRAAKCADRFLNRGRTATTFPHRAVDGAGKWRYVLRRLACRRPVDVPSERCHRKGNEVTNSQAQRLRRFDVYQAYKDSDVDWLGPIPAHWELKRLKFAADLTAGQSPPSECVREDLGELPFLQGNADFGSYHPTPHQSCDIAPKVAEPSDILISVRAPVGAINVADRRYGIGRGLCAIRPKRNLDRHFAFYSLATTKRELHAIATGSTYDAVSTPEIGDLPALLPPCDEQQTIAAFLDRETARIDQLVAKKQRLIDLLHEKRSALISHVVTQGLNANVPMRHTGVKWLGTIPAHWTVQHLRWAITFQRGHDLPTETRNEGEVPVVSSSGISSTHSTAIAKAPGIVTGRYGTIGNFHLITQDYWPLNTTLYSIDLRGNDPRFLRYMLTHLSPLFLLNAVKSAVPGIDRNDIHPTSTAVPPIREQLAIADFLDEKIAGIEALVTKVRGAVERLIELRGALISAAVTGKIDVRASEQHVFEVVK
jgi:type I restriction enzyme S subunit